MKLVVCGGGTGGHIYPALAVVTALREMVADLQLLWIGTTGQTEEQLVPRAGIPLQTIRGGAMVGVPLSLRLKNGMLLGRSIGTAYRLLRQFQPDVLLLTGGYVNVPVALVAKWLGVPALIYLPDVEPGSAIKFLIRFAEKVACTSEESRAFVPASKLIVTGYPVRPELRAALSHSQADALAQFDLQSGRPTLFVFGGSRGAQSINRAVGNILPELLTQTQLIHVSGTATWAETESNVQKVPASLRSFYRPYPYLHEEMGLAFRAADLVIARAGASMLGESPAFGLPAILVPYPHAWRYQKVNADYLVSRGAALRLNDEEMGQKLLPTIQTLLRQPTRLSQMATAAQQLDQPQAAQKIGQALQGLIR